MVGWQLSRGQAALNAADLERLAQLAGPFSKFALQATSVAAGSFHRQTGEHGLALPDPDRLGVAKDPRNRRTWAPLIDREPCTEICWKIDIAAWKATLLNLLAC